MDRKTFKKAYRDARVHLRTFTSDKYDRDTQSAAEERWILGVRSPVKAAYEALGLRTQHSVASVSTLCNGALHAYRHGFYYGRSLPWQEWVRERLREGVFK